MVMLGDGDATMLTGNASRVGWKMDLGTARTREKGAHGYNAQASCNEVDDDDGVPEKEES